MAQLYQLIAGFIANIIQRAFGSRPNAMLTVTGLISAVAAALAAFPPAALPPKYQPVLGAASAILALVVGVLGHGQNAPLQLDKPAGKPLEFAGK